MSLTINISTQVLELGADPHPLALYASVPELTLTAAGCEEPLVLSTVNPALEITSAVMDLLLKTAESSIDLGVNIPVTGPATGITNLFIAACPMNTAVGDCVYASGPKVLDKYQVAPVDIGDYLKIPSIGIVIAKTSPTLCVVQWIGELVGVLTGLVTGRSYFVGVNAQPTVTPPVATLPSSYRYVQKVGVALSDDVLLIIPSLDLAKTIH